jgi:thymidine kinase
LSRATRSDLVIEGCLCQLRPSNARACGLASALAASGSACVGCAGLSTTLHQAPQNTGWIEVICGPMFSGKTEELIRRLKRALIGQQKVQIFKPRLDQRYADAAIVSHSDQRLEGVPLDRIEDLPPLLKADTQVVGIDEVQFFGASAVGICEQLAGRGLRVIAAGLDQDYRGVPFEPMPQLLAVAEYVSKELAVCVVCGNPAGRSQRLVGDERRILVGAYGAYEARCRACFRPEGDSPTEPAAGAQPWLPLAIPPP